MTIQRNVRPTATGRRQLADAHRDGDKRPRIEVERQYMTRKVRRRMARKAKR